MTSITGEEKILNPELEDIYLAMCLRLEEIDSPAWPEGPHVALGKAVTQEGVKLMLDIRPAFPAQKGEI